MAGKAMSIDPADRIPNAATRQAMAEARAGQPLKQFATAADCIAAMEEAAKEPPIAHARAYPAIVERAKIGFGVCFPDFPGCVAKGDTLDLALLNAVAALAFHVEGLIEDGEALPEPSALDTMPHDPEVGEVLRTLIHFDLPK